MWSRSVLPKTSKTKCFFEKKGLDSSLNKTALFWLKPFALFNLGIVWFSVQQKTWQWTCQGVGQFNLLLSVGNTPRPFASTIEIMQEDRSRLNAQQIACHDLACIGWWQLSKAQSFQTSFIDGLWNVESKPTQKWLLSFLNTQLLRWRCEQTGISCFEEIEVTEFRVFIFSW